MDNKAKEFYEKHPGEEKPRKIWQFLGPKGRRDHFEAEKFLDGEGNLMENEFDKFIDADYDDLPYEDRRIVIESAPYIYEELASQDYWKEYFNEK